MAATAARAGAGTCDRYVVQSRGRRACGAGAAHAVPTSIADTSKTSAARRPVDERIGRTPFPLPSRNPPAAAGRPYYAAGRGADCAIRPGGPLVVGVSGPTGPDRTEGGM